MLGRQGPIAKEKGASDKVPPLTPTPQPQPLVWALVVEGPVSGSKDVWQGRALSICPAAPFWWMEKMSRRQSESSKALATSKAATPTPREALAPASPPKAGASVVGHTYQLLPHSQGPGGISSMTPLEAGACGWWKPCLLTLAPGAQVIVPEGTVGPTGRGAPGESGPPATASVSLCSHQSPSWIPSLARPLASGP